MHRAQSDGVDFGSVVVWSDLVFVRVVWLSSRVLETGHGEVN